MVYELFHGACCWRCLESQAFLFEAEGFLLDHDPFVWWHKALCFQCIRDSVVRRLEFEGALDQGERWRLHARDSYFIERICVRRQVIDYVIEDWRRFNTGAILGWLLGAMRMPACVLCSNTRAFNVYEEQESRFPMFTMCRTCIRQLLIDNQDYLNPTQLFNYVQCIGPYFRLQRLQWASMELVEFLVD